MSLLRRGRGIEHEYILNTDPPLGLDANVERRKLIANAIEGLISVTSPVGKALLGHKRGDIVKIDVPAGTLEYKIIKISR